MLTPVWTLISWPKVWFPLEQHRNIATQIQHLSTSVNADKNDDGCVCGQVLFGLQSATEMFGVAWDWVAIGGRILAISDPMAIVSNVYFVGDNGVMLQESARLVQLNNVINHLPWQRPVRRNLPRRDAGRAYSPAQRVMPDYRPAAQQPLRIS